jgi:hypothetical protein
MTECEPGLTCTYGGDPRLGCRDQYSCDDNGNWLIASAACVPFNDCLDTELYAPLPSIGAACPELEDICYTESGIICSCGFCSNDCANELVWNCEQKNDPCPHFPPNVGQPCGALEIQCGYVPCPSEPRRNGLRRWHLAGGARPVPRRLSSSFPKVP